MSCFPSKANKNLKEIQRKQLNKVVYRRKKKVERFVSIGDGVKEMLELELDNVISKYLKKWLGVLMFGCIDQKKLELDHLVSWSYV